MRNTRLIGLVGGLGPAATMHYYNGLLEECARSAVQLRLVINHADVERVLDASARGAVDELAEHLAENMLELTRAGAELLAISAVTPHVCAPKLKPIVRVPVVDIVDVINTEIRRQKIDRVVLLGTRQTIASRLFGRLEAAAIDPSHRQTTRCHELYLSIVRDGLASREVTDEFGRLAAEIARDGGVQTIVLAGTELALVPGEVWGTLNAIDCANLHIQAIVAAAGQTSPVTL